MRKTADDASSPIIFSSERRGISHVSPDGSHASEELLYNIKIYRLQSIKELEGQIQCCVLGSQLFLKFQFVYSVMNLNLWPLINIYTFYNFKKILMLFLDFNIGFFLTDFI